MVVEDGIKLLTAVVTFLTAVVGLGVAGRKTHLPGPAAPRKSIANRLLKWVPLAVLFVASIVLFGAWREPRNPPIDPDKIFWQELTRRDPLTFYGSPDGHYDIARLIPDRPHLDEHSYVSILQETKRSFDVAVIDGHHLLGTYRNEIEEAVKRGVAVRVIMFDTSPANEDNCKALAEATNQTCKEIRTKSEKVQRELTTAREHLETATAPGSLEVRLYRNVVLNTMWIKDCQDETSAMGLLRSHLYYDHEKWPTFIFSKDGKQLIPNLGHEFEAMWGKSALLIKWPASRSAGSSCPSTP